MFEGLKNSGKNKLKSVFRTATFLLSLITFVVASIVGFFGRFMPKRAREKLEVPCSKVYGFVENCCNNGEEHTIIEATNRQMTHYAYHIGQITFLAKHFKSKDWKTLSVPKNKSAEFNEFLKQQKTDGKEKSHPLSAPQEFAEKNK